MKREPQVPAIEAIKESENLQVLMLIMDDPDAKLMLAAWTVYPIEKLPSSLLRPLEKNETPLSAYWRLWKDCAGLVDVEKLSRISGIPFQSTLIIFDRLKIARMVYPDGTINLNALKILQTEVGGYLRRYVPRESWRKTASEKPSLTGHVGTKTG